MFLAALFKISKSRNNSSTHQLMGKLWYVHIMEDYSAIKQNLLLIYATTWIELKKHYAKRNKPNSKDYMLYDSTYVTFSSVKTIVTRNR